jgi:hypothetical protein
VRRSPGPRPALLANKVREKAHNEGDPVMGQGNQGCGENAAMGVSRKNSWNMNFHEEDQGCYTPPT